MSDYRTIKTTNGGGSSTIFNGGGLALGTFTNGSSGDSLNGRQTTFFAGTRLYTNFETNSDNADPSYYAVNLDIFNSGYGSYYYESTITVTLAMLSDATGETLTGISWCSDGNYIYAVVSYVKTSGTGWHKVDIVRFDLDGTNNVATNIDTTAETNGDSAYWKGPADGTPMSTCYGGYLYTNFSHHNGVVYELQFRKYSIAGLVYTLVNTYTVTPANIDRDMVSLSYNPNNSKFYIGYFNDTQIDKFIISGSAFTQDSIENKVDVQFSSFNFNGEYHNSISDFSFTSTTVTVYYISLYSDSWYSGSNSRSKGSWVLKSITYPIF